MIDSERDQSTDFLASSHHELLIRVSLSGFPKVRWSEFSVWPLTSNLVMACSQLMCLYSSSWRITIITKHRCLYFQKKLKKKTVFSQIGLICKYLYQQNKDPRGFSLQIFSEFLDARKEIPWWGMWTEILETYNSYLLLISSA